MNEELVSRLLLYITAKLQEMKAPVSPVRLICLLYLVDLEYYRRHGKLLTGLEWINVDYDQVLKRL